MRFIRFSQPALLSICLLALPCGRLHAQGNGNTAQQPIINLAVTDADRAAATSYSGYKVHIRPVNTPGKDRFSPFSTGEASAEALPGANSALSSAETESALTAALSVPTVPSPGFYPADLSYLGGRVLGTTQSHPIYVDCPASCWGDPATFLSHFDNSQFIHVTDQYVGSNTSGRYKLGTASSISYPVFAPLADSDILQIVHAGAKKLGTGYTHVYHVFLPKGVDVCFVGTTQCYSPDNPSTFAFCAYHGYVNFSDIGHVLLTVEPYEDVAACSEAQPTPNGALVDSTANSLSHELTETITDPDLNAWIVVQSNGIVGEEIGDVCSRIKLGVPGFFNPPTLLDGKEYAIQPEYSNKYHACSYAGS